MISNGSFENVSIQKQMSTTGRNTNADTSSKSSSLGLSACVLMTEMCGGGKLLKSAAERYLRVPERL
jgi:hypothetical protein